MTSKASRETATPPTSAPMPPPAQVSSPRARLNIRERLGKHSVELTDVPAIPLPVGFATRHRTPTAEPRPQRDLTVTVGADLVEARRRTRRVASIAASAACGLGVVVGHVLGSAGERAAQWRTATEGAHELATEIGTGNERGKVLASAVTRLLREIESNPLDRSDVTALTEVTLGLETRLLPARGVGSFSGDLQGRVLEYATLTATADQQRERLALLLGKRGRELLATAVGQRDRPRVYWAVRLRPGPQGVAARLLPLREPFAESGTWPDALTLSATASEAEASVRRLTTLGEEERETRGAIPVAASTLGPIDAFHLLQLVRSRLRELHTTLEGDGAEHPGLLQRGAELEVALDAVGTNP
jgi:hypothetical protein